nr:hypothetical protein [Tanacetum cinerariifolium]
MSLKDVHVKLSLVIPGRKNPGQNLDVFLQSLIKELKTLWNDGVETYDAYRKNNFNMKATLLWTVSDFPAYAMLSGWNTHGKLACPYCMGNMDSFQLHNGGKPCWFDCHRRFLPARHPYRRDRKEVRFSEKNKTRLNREPRKFALDIHCSSPTDTRLNIFKVPSHRLFDTGTKRNLTNAEKHKAHTSILLNCEYVHPFLRLFDKYIIQEDPYIDEETLDRARYEKFAQWFKEHIQSNGGNKHLKILAREPMRYVESHKGERNATCSNTTINANKNTEIEKVADLEVGDVYMKVSENEELFVDTYENLEVNEAEEEFIDRYDDLDDKNELALSDHSSDEDEVNLSDHSSDEDEVNLSDHSSNEDEVNLSDYSLNDYKGRGMGWGRGRSGNGRGRSISRNIVIGSSSNVSSFGNQEDATCDNSSRSGGRGMGISGNIGIGGGSSNVSGFGNQEDANYDNGSRSGGMGIGGSSCNVSGFGNQEDANYDNGSRSGGRGRGISGNIVIGSSSNVSGFGNQEDANCDIGSKSGGKGRGISRNIGIGGSSCNVSGFGNQEDENYDNGCRSGGRGSGISGNICIGGGSSNVSGFEAREGVGAEVEISALVMVVMYSNSVIKMQIMIMVAEAGEGVGA